MQWQLFFSGAKTHRSRTQSWETVRVEHGQERAFSVEICFKIVGNP